MKENKIIFNEIVYVREDSLSNSDVENLGKTIGIAFEIEKSVKDYIFPYWVKEYKNDKGHNRIFVRSFMDLGTVYERKSD